MPSKVRCPWIMCNNNSQHLKVGEIGECQFSGAIELYCPDEGTEHDQFDPISSECCIEVDDVLRCMQFNR